MTSSNLGKAIEQPEIQLVQRLENIRSRLKAQPSLVLAFIKMEPHDRQHVQRKDSWGDGFDNSFDSFGDSWDNF